MTHPPQTIVDYCTENGWTDPYLQEGEWWAFHPNAVMPLPVPVSLYQYNIPDDLPTLTSRAMERARLCRPSLVEMGEQYGRIPTSDRPRSFTTEIAAVDEFRRFYRVTTEYFIIGIYQDDNFRGKPNLRITPQGQWADIARLQLALESVSFQNSGDVAKIDIKTNYQDLPIPRTWECIRHYELGLLDFSNPDPLPYRLTLHLQ